MLAVHCRHQQELELMQMKQQQELQRYLQQVQQNIETVSASELLQALMAQQTYLGQQPVASASTGLSAGTVLSSIVQLSPPPGVVYSTAGLHQSPLPTTYMPQSLDVSGLEAVMSSATVPAATAVDTSHTVSVAGATTLSPSAIEGLTSADIWSEPAVPVADVMSLNADTAAIPGSLDVATKSDVAKNAEMADMADGRCSPGTSQTDSINSLKDDVRPATASSDWELSNNEETLNVTVHREQSLDAASVPLPSDAVDKLSDQLSEVSSLGFVPIQNQLIFSRSDSMASSVAGCSLPQSVECPDVHQPTSIRETSVGDSKCVTSAQPVTAVGVSTEELLDTLQSLLSQFATGNCDAVPAVTPSHSLPLATNEPTQQLQQSQAMIQQQQQQQLAAIASAIENLQHLRSLQEVIGNLAVALKASQLEMLSAALQAGELSTSSTAPVPPPTSNVAGSGTMPAALRPPTVAMSSSPAVHVSAAVPPAGAVMPEHRSLPPLGLLQYPTAGNAALLMQQQQQLMLLAMMQSAPCQQQLLMPQLLSQNAMVMQEAGGPTGAHVAQQPWPAMMQRATPGLPVMMSAQHAPQRLGVPASQQTVMTPGSLPPPAVQAAAQAPVPVRPPVTSSSSTTGIPSLQTSLPDQQ